MVATEPSTTTGADLLASADAEALTGRIGLLVDQREARLRFGVTQMIEEALRPLEERIQRLEERVGT
jgi:hypothetical protein